MPEIVEPTPNNNPDSRSGIISFGGEEVPIIESSLQDKIGELVEKKGQKLLGVVQDSGKGFKNALSSYIGKKV